MVKKKISKKGKVHARHHARDRRMTFFMHGISLLSALMATAYFFFL